jgi:exodeoxyribonuclease VII small subunit
MGNCSHYSGEINPAQLAPWIAASDETAWAGGRQGAQRHDCEAVDKLSLQFPRMPEPMSPADKAQAAPSFEAALNELETIVQDMEAGKLSLEDSLAAYQRGAALLKYCQNALAVAEQKIQVLEVGELRDFGGPTGTPPA